MKNIIFLDIDGTILPEGEEVVSEEVVCAIKQVQKNGHKVFICTGRNEKAAKSIIDQLELGNYVTSNGQNIVVDSKVVFRHHIRRNEMEDVMAVIKKHTDMYALENDTGLKTEATQEGEKLAKLIKGHGFTHVEATNDIDLNKIFQVWAFGEKHQVDKVQEELKDVVDCYRWTDTAMEIATKDYGKGIGVKQVKSIIGEASKTFGFGDGVNDFSMMEAVDVSVAMGNAVEELKQYCDITTGHCKEDGLIEAFKKLNLL